MKTIGGKYVRRVDFHESKEFKKIDKHINTCLTLLERLVKFNKECEEIVSAELKVDDYIIDYRTEQFKFYHKTLGGIYYSCYSLKDIYNISTPSLAHAFSG